MRDEGYGWASIPVVSTFIDMSWWDDCTVPDAKPVVTDPSLSVWVDIDSLKYLN